MIKGFILSIMLILASMGAAQAQYFDVCIEPVEPTIPVGSYASKYEMDEASDAVRLYIETAKEFQDCLRANDKTAESNIRRVKTEWENANMDFDNR